MIHTNNFATKKDFWDSVNGTLELYEISIENSRRYFTENTESQNTDSQQYEYIDLDAPYDFHLLHLQILFSECASRLWLPSDHEETIGRFLNRTEIEEIVSLCLSYEENLFKEHGWNKNQLQPGIEHPMMGRLLSVAYGHDHFSTPISEQLFRLYDRSMVFSALAMIAAYQCEIFFRNNCHELALEMATIAQRADEAINAFFFQEQAEEREGKKKSNATQAGIARRIETLFRYSVFLPSWEEWQTGGLDYPTTEAFLYEMDRQARTFLKENGANKETISKRSFQNWIQQIRTV
jgi:hypothetical protein